jgi:hypothetical protein
MKKDQHGMDCDVPWEDLYRTREAAGEAASNASGNSTSILYEIKQCSNCGFWYLMASGRR